MVEDVVDEVTQTAYISSVEINIVIWIAGRESEMTVVWVSLAIYSLRVVLRILLSLTSIASNITIYMDSISICVHIAVPISIVVTASECVISIHIREYIPKFLIKVVVRYMAGKEIILTRVEIEVANVDIVISICFIRATSIVIAINVVIRVVVIIYIWALLLVFWFTWIFHLIPHPVVDGCGISVIRVIKWNDVVVAVDYDVVYSTSIVFALENIMWIIINK